MVNISITFKYNITNNDNIQQQLPISSMNDIQSTLELSDTKVLKLAKELR